MAKLSLLRPSRFDAPWWVLPVFSFIAGGATAATVLLPDATTPDFQRGHAAGYEQGWYDAIAMGNKNLEGIYNQALEARAKAEQ